MVRHNNVPIDVILERMREEERGFAPVDYFQETPQEKPKMPNLEKIAEEAFRMMNQQIIRAFSVTSNRVGLAKEYLSKFARGFILNDNQMNIALGIFTGYIRNKISQIKILKEQWEDFNSVDSEERKKREKEAYRFILSELDRKERIATENPSDIFRNLAIDFYNENGFEIKNYEIRKIIKDAERGTLYLNGKLVSLRRQVNEVSSFNNPEDRKRRMGSVWKEIAPEVLGKKEIPFGRNPLDSLKEYVESAYEKLNLPKYMNEVGLVANRLLRFMSFDLEARTMTPLNLRISPSYT